MFDLIFEKGKLKFHLENFLKYKGKLVISLEFFARGNVQKFLVGKIKNETSIILCKKVVRRNCANWSKFSRQKSPFESIE